jgi:hypothetical protein
MNIELIRAAPFVVAPAEPRHCSQPLYVLKNCDFRRARREKAGPAPNAAPIEAIDEDRAGRDSGETRHLRSRGAILRRWRSSASPPKKQNGGLISPSLSMRERLGLLAEAMPPLANVRDIISFRLE